MPRKLIERLNPCIRSIPPAAIAILFLVVTLAGCDQNKPRIGTAANAFREAIQETIDRHCPDLARKVARGDRKGIEATLATLYESTGHANNSPYGFLAVLDNNGVTITAKSRQEATGTQNYGNYQIVSRVLHKKNVLQSTLYLQGGKKVFIIGVPLPGKNKVAGVLILGIDPEYLQCLSITEQEFMALTFSHTPVRQS